MEVDPVVDLEPVEEAEDDSSAAWFAVLIIALSVGFIIPWIFLIYCQLKKRALLREIKTTKDIKLQQLLKITTEGSRIRSELRGQNGEVFRDVGLREVKF